MTQQRIKRCPEQTQTKAINVYLAYKLSRQESPTFPYTCRRCAVDLDFLSIHVCGF